MTNLFERSFLMALGAAVLTKEMAESLVDELLKKGEASSAEGRKIVEETVEQAREETKGIKARFDETLERNFREMGLVTAGQIEEMQLKIAQLEHRISLLEAGAPTAAAGGEMPGGEPPAGASEEYHHMREQKAESEALTPRLDTP